MATIEEVSEFFHKVFPGTGVNVEQVGNRSARLRKKLSKADLRPGGTVSGPALMELADAIVYVAIQGEIGIVPMAVTTNFNMNFLRMPAAECDVLVECRLIKLGKRLAVGEVYLFSEGSEEPVAHAIVTYALPTPA